MKSKSNPFLASVIAITMLQYASAATGTWSGPANGTWDTTDTNWSGLPVGFPWDGANGPSNTAVFNTSALAAVVGGTVDTNGITFTLTGALSGGSINLAGTTPAIAVASGETGTISSTVAGSAGLIKSGAGLLTLSNATYTGGTTVTGGRLVLENTKTGSSTFTTNAELEFNHSSGTQQLDGGTISGTGKLIKTGGSTLMLGGNGSAQTVSLASGALIDVQGGTLRNEYGQGVWTNNLADLNVASGATFDTWDCNTIVDAISGTGTINKGWWGNNSLTIGVDNGSSTFSGTITNSAGPLTLIKNGTGTQTLTGSIGHTGGTTVNGGRLVLLDTTTGSANLTTNAELEFNFTSGTRQINGGTINGSGKLIKTGTGILMLGANGSAQTVALTAGSLIDVQGGVLRNEYGNSAWGGNKADLNVESGAFFDIWDGDTVVDALSGSGTINKGWEFNNSLTFGADNGSGTFSGTISQGSQSYGGSSGGSFSLIKNGSGTQTLSGNNTYAGTTTVNQGKLIVGVANAGSLGGTAVTVKNGATLGGSGTIGAATALESGAIHAAGNSVGIQKFTGNLTYQDGSIFAWEIDRDATQTRGTGYDAVNVAGTLAGTDGTGDSALFRIVISDADFSDPFWASNNHSWSDIFTAADGTTAKADWKNIFGGGFEYYNGNTAITAPVTGSFGWSNNNTLTWTAVPEPSSALAGLLIGAGLLRRRRTA